MMNIPLNFPNLPLPVPAQFPIVNRLPDVDTDTALEAWLYGVTYLTPAAARMARNIEKVNPVELFVMALGFAPASLPAASMVLTSKMMAPNFVDPLHQLGYDVISVGTVENNLLLETMLAQTGFYEFTRPGWRNGLKKFRDDITANIKVSPLPSFPVPYISIGVPELNMANMTAQQKFEYTVAYTDMLWIERQVNLARQTLPITAPFLDSTLVSFSVINTHYSDYLINRANATYDSKSISKIMFGADSDIYHGLWLSLYDNAAEFRNPEFISAVNKLAELLQIAAMNTGV